MKKLKTILTIVLSVLLFITYVPVNTNSVYADDNKAYIVYDGANYYDGDTIIINDTENSVGNYFLDLQPVSTAYSSYQLSLGDNNGFTYAPMLGGSAVSLNGETVWTSSTYTLMVWFASTSSGTQEILIQGKNGDDPWETVATVTVSLNPVEEVNYVAQIGETQYETLAAAINAANDDTSSNAITIKLLADLDFSDDEYKAYKWSGSNVNPLAITRSNVTLDLNGKTISNMGNCALGVGSIYAKDGTITNVTIKNGTLLAGKTDNVTNSYVLLIGGTNNCLIDSVTTLGGVNNCNNSNVVIKDSTIRGTKYYTVCAQTGANVTIRGTSYTKNTDQTVQTKAMFWVQGAGTDEDLITSSNPTGAFNASIITIESGYFNVDSNGAFYLGGGLAPTLTGGYYNIDPAAYVADGYAVESVSEEYEGVTYTYHVTTKKVVQIGNVQYETLAAAIEAAADNTQTTIVMIADEDIEGNTGVTVPSTKNIVLDLNGHTIQNLVNENKASQVITNKGTLTVTDNSANGDGVIRNNVADGTVAGNWYSTPQANYVTNVITNYGNLVINGGTLYQTSNGYIAFAVDNITNGNLHTPVATINGGTLKSEMTTVRLFCNSTTNLNTVVMTGGNVESKRHAFYLQNANSNANKGSLEITDGTVSSTLNYLQVDAGANPSELSASISGGKFVGALSVDGTFEGFISGGKYAVAPGSSYIAEGYEAAANTDEDSETYPYIVQARTYVAQIGQTKYTSFDAAVAAANSGDTIVLLDDIYFGTDRSVPVWGNNGEQPFNIDLNGHTFQTDSEVSIDAGNNGYKASAFCFAFDNEANITVSGGDIKTAFGAGVYVSGENVNLTLEDVDIAQNYPQNVQTTNEYSSAVRITYEGSVEINGGTYGGKNSIAVSNTGGKVVINDGTFYNDIFFSNYTSKSYYDNTRYAVKSITINGGTFLGNFVNPDKGSLVIKGGTFVVDPSAYVPAGYAAIELPDGKFVVGEVSSNTIDGRKGSDVVEIAPVIVTEGAEKTAIVSPADVTTDKNTTTSISHSALNTYAYNKDVDTVKIITGLSATQYIGSDAAPQTIITDDQGKTIFEAVARGGQLRYDKKLDGTDVIGTYEQTHNKSTAIDYADVRLQFKFKLPEGVSVSDSNTSWNWTVTYTRANNEEVSKTVNGVNYLPVAGETNTFTSNVVITNVPVTANQGVNFKATLNITYVLDGVTYTISQSSEVPLARTIADMVNYYKGAAWYDLSDEAKAYIDGLNNYID